MSKKKSKTLVVQCPEGEEPEKYIAKKYLKPEVTAAASIKAQYQNSDLIDINHLVSGLREQIKKVQDDDLSTPEAMLVTQAHTLDQLFTDMIVRSRNNMGEYFDAAEKYMKLALKAQSQCRTTLEALSEIKNPKPYIQNNRARYQQVNNGSELSRVRENEKLNNEQLEDKSDEWMDTGTPEETIRDDQEMETMGEEHGAKD